MIKCNRCDGRMFLDRVFTENKNYEIYCVMCGDRKFVSKSTELGEWLDRQETRRMRAGVLVSGTTST